MTFYVLMQHVDFEGSSFKGTFKSLDDTFDHIDQLDGYCMDEFLVDREGGTPLDAYNLESIPHTTAGWVFNGPSDLSFYIYACVVGG